MKTLIKIAVIAVMITAGSSLKAQDYPKEYLGLPGDNLNLYAVMNTFQESRSLRVFERSINDPDNRINNLDLNGDNLVDYIMVSDYVDGNVHYIVLRVAINRKEKQDVAVFTVQRINNGEVYVQLTGDEALYGKNYIIEPAGQLLLADWPLVRSIFRTNYTVWESGWGWGFYPDYWVAWSPVYWHWYYGYNYYRNDYWYTCYHRSYAHHDPHWRDHYYTGYRVWSPVVTVNIHSGHYRTTYSHPEQRRDGEAVYNRNNPDQGRRATYSTSTGTGSNDNRQGNSAGTSGRRTGSAETYSTSRDERPATTTTHEVRTIGSSTREERSVQPEERRERSVQPQTREQRPVTSSASEVRTIGSSEREQRPVQQEVREERTVQPQVREQRPVQQAVREERTVQPQVREQRPVQQAVREERPVQATPQRSNESERQVKSNSGGERAAAATSNTEKEKKIDSAGTTRRK